MRNHVIALAAVFAVGACQDLTVTNPNVPDRARATKQPAATEAFVLSFVAILVSDFFLGLMLNQIYESIWPLPSGRTGP